MKNRSLCFLLSTLIIVFSISLVAHAHSGGTDSNGGHYNHSTGEYHYHHGYSAHDHYDMDGDGDDDCPYNFVSITTSSSSSSSSISNTSSCTGYHYTYDEIIEYKIENYEDGYDDGYEKGKAEGRLQATEELTAKHEEELKQAKRQQKIIIFAICAIFVFIVSPMIVSAVSASAEGKSKTKIQNLIDENAKLKKQLQDKAKSSNITTPPRKFNSSVIKDLIYNDQTLTITLTTGSTYHYQNVPKSVYEEMLKARSIGQFYNYKIKNKYPYY